MADVNTGTPVCDDAAMLTTSLRESGGATPLAHCPQHHHLACAVETWEAALGAPLDGFARFVVKDGMEFGSTRVWWESASHPRRSGHVDDAHESGQHSGGDSLMTTASACERDTGAVSFATDTRNRERRSPHEGTDYAVYLTTGALFQSEGTSAHFWGNVSDTVIFVGLTH